MLLCDVAMSLGRRMAADELTFEIDPVGIDLCVCKLSDTAFETSSVVRCSSLPGPASLHSLP